MEGGGYPSKALAMDSWGIGISSPMTYIQLTQQQLCRTKLFIFFKSPFLP
jgi:hypothetical protein